LMLWQVNKVTGQESKTSTVQALTEAVAAQPVALELAIRRVLWSLRGADAGNAEAALEQAERELTALLCHDRPETD
jgi:hypothetical protein